MLLITSASASEGLIPLLALHPHALKPPENAYAVLPHQPLLLRLAVNARYPLSSPFCGFFVYIVRRYGLPGCGSVFSRAAAIAFVESCWKLIADDPDVWYWRERLNPNAVTASQVIVAETGELRALLGTRIPIRMRKEESPVRGISHF
jgi:hypothetical protein